MKKFFEDNEMIDRVFGEASSMPKDEPTKGEVSDKEDADYETHQDELMEKASMAYDKMMKQLNAIVSFMKSLDPEVLDMFIESPMFDDEPKTMQAAVAALQKHVTSIQHK